MAFHVAQGENVAMTFESKTHLPSDGVSEGWALPRLQRAKLARQAEQPLANKPAGDEFVFPAISAPPTVWPRIFPGL
jgi:hypothetical protein